MPTAYSRVSYAVVAEDEVGTAQTFVPVPKVYVRAPTPLALIVEFMNLS